MAHRSSSQRIVSVLALGAALSSFAGAQSVLYTRSGDKANDRLGVCTRSAGDVNKDGFPDFITGAPENGDLFNPGQGFARVYSGVNGAVLYTRDGTTNVDGFGTSVNGAGDLDRDGYADFLVGAPKVAGSAGANAGKVYVYSGKTGGVLLSFEGLVSAEGLGESVAGAGDVNNDGFVDVIAGAPLAPAGGTNRGLARVYSGLSGGVLYTFPGAANEGRVGAAVDGAGDVNADGYDDLLVGSYLVGAKIYSGKTGVVLRTFTAPTDDRLGVAVAGVGDVDGDLTPDVIVGAPQDGGFFSHPPGYAKVYSGLTGAVIFTLNGVADFDRFGIAVGAASDVDCDGRADLIVGADQMSTGLPGYVELVRGIDASSIHHVDGSANNERCGASVAGLGDVNGDGLFEFVIGAPANSSAFLQAGQLKVWSAAEGCSACPPPATYCQSSMNSTGFPALIGSSGTTSVAANDFVLECSGLPAGALGRYFYGANQSAPNTPFGNGFRCVADPFFRLPPFNISGSGTATFAVDYNALVPPGDINPGSVWNFQFWYRNPAAGGANFNVSDGLNATFCP